MSRLALQTVPHEPDHDEELTERTGRDSHADAAERLPGR